MKFKLWSKISAVFLTFWAFDNSYILTRDVYNYIVDSFGFFAWNFTGTLGLIATFLIGFLPYFLPSIPLWYYGFFYNNKSKSIKTK